MLIIINFSAYDPYFDQGLIIPLNTSGGLAPPITFGAHYPPELGCLGFGADPGLHTGTGIVSDIVARVTLKARQMVARSVVDGTSIKIVEMALGAGGYDAADPTRALWVDPEAVDLDNEFLRRAIDVVELPGYVGSRAFVCRFDPESFMGGVGEIGLIAEIQNSPYPAENGTKFLFALAHQGLNTKTKHHVQTYRIFVTL